MMNGDSGTLHRDYYRPFRLSGEWEVALTHLKMPERSFPVYVLCDLIEHTYVDNTLVQFLDFWNTKNHRIATPTYVRLVKKRFSSINVNIKREPNQEDLLTSAHVTCVLHFRKV